MPVARGTRAGGTPEDRPGAIGDRSIRAGTPPHAQRPKTMRSRAGNGTAAQGTETLLADTTIRASRMIGERAAGKVPGLPPPGQSGMAIGKKHWRDKIKAHTDGQDTSRTVSNLVDKQKMKKAGQDRDAAEDPNPPIACARQTVTRTEERALPLRGPDHARTRRILIRTVKPTKPRQ